jgi:hypothetical protein
MKILQKCFLSNKSFVQLGNMPADNFILNKGWGMEYITNKLLTLIYKNKIFKGARPYGQTATLSNDKASINERIRIKYTNCIGLGARSRDP